MPSHNTNPLTWVSLTLNEGYLLTAIPPDLGRGVAPLGPPAPAQPSLLGHGAAPLTFLTRDQIHTPLSGSMES